MRLDRAQLDRLPPAIRRPAYDRSRVTPGIVHLGLGAFHRAHQAVVIDDCLGSGAMSWGIVGASLRSPDTRDALAPQDHLYTVAVRAAEGTEHRVIGALLDSVVAREKPAALVERMADPAVRIVSLTVTEKGYCHTPQTGDLDERHPDVVHDLNNPDAPRSAPGFIVAALARRRAQGLAPFTVLCCDNLAANGHTVQRIVTQFAALRSRDLGKWIADNIAFPSTMVDRIVPETTDADRSAVSDALGLHDAWPVMTEPFTQWVVEDRFAAGRPDLAAAGVELVADVKPFELMKLRLLNASHSALAYLGYLAGYETIADTMAAPHFARLAAQVMEESAVTLTMPVGTDLAAYRNSLLKRFANPALHHRTWQIAMDGSQKLPQRLLGTMNDRLARNLPIATHALAVAGWMRYVTANDEQGRAIDVRDPLAGEFATLAREAGPVADRLAPALLGVAKVFGPLGIEPRLREAVTAALGQLYAKGSRRAVETLVSV
ncbi:mannitol dehydrogenase family protein [Bradyrhizobium diazoefficiens]|nr:mannitol dehydrogenase family protein [Bradyrhizobium diazoefficiens]UCF51776.1 MAG: mannitol dehydrogenase family protein [Bradyrhizobium sp.]MBR0963536.1 mannitol dehydrogenase family protein [Bradyrhizobium diazoefficiens]MBR0976349.1 mannitol dehydrogenase family protein [Bradyrhizobium diazoefficiens]MBR1007197.1 mannitol dehydrogenase family protein [Bradyrhizobium diazoefficiens]MBR1013309.1 mannitol dehydrogenase family protein [Bradyrhizobium diazoefficiens]